MFSLFGTAAVITMVCVGPGDFKTVVTVNLGRELITTPVGPPKL
jgi:hypothetical protein